jgi:hypothetical protein
MIENVQPANLTFRKVVIPCGMAALVGAFAGIFLAVEVLPHQLVMTMKWWLPGTNLHTLSQLVLFLITPGIFAVCCLKPPAFARLVCYFYFLGLPAPTVTSFLIFTILERRIIF